MMGTNKKAILGMDDNMKRLLIILIAILLIASTTRFSLFVRLGNFQTIGKQLVEYGLMALGVSLCMISGGIDLSTVYVANLAGIVAALFMQKYAPADPGTQQMVIMLAAVVIALIIGACCGIFNGFLVSFLRIPAMLATLGTYQLYMGIAIVISGGSTVSGIRSFTPLGTHLLFDVIPVSFIVFILSAIVIGLIMSKTNFGTRVYLVGTNDKAARFAGIQNKIVIIKTYMISGIISALAGLISLSRINSAKADFGSSYTMQCILIAVLGGVNPNGGFGNISGVAIAVVILQILSSYLNMFPSINNFYRDLIWGVALIGVLVMNTTINKRKKSKA